MTGPKHISFTVHKNKMYAQATILNDALKDFVNGLYRVNDGIKYDCDEVNKSFAWLREKFNEFEKSHLEALSYSDTCPCGSDLVPHKFNEYGEAVCKNCEDVLEIGL